jgi:hypothetical protein
MMGLERHREEGFADAPAPVLQRMIGRRPVISALGLVAIFGLIARHTGVAAWNYRIPGETGHLGVLFVWTALMIMLLAMGWMLWVASRLRWIGGQVLISNETADPEKFELLHRAGSVLVIVSSRSRRVVRWFLGLSLFLSTIGLGMMIIASGHVSR